MPAGLLTCVQPEYGQNSCMTILALLVRADDTVVIPNSGGLSSGQLWTIFVGGLGIACVVLYKSMKKQLGRISAPKDEQ